jgi:hypothetical protein
MPTNQPKPKIIVAAHGVGNQVMSETVQKVINRFCRYHGETMGVPLGKIKNLSVQKNPYEKKSASGQTNSSECLCKPFKMSDLGYDGELGKLYFVEVHWADLARKVDENRFLLEEPKSWSKTIVERLPKRYKEAADLSPKEFGTLRLLLREMLETLRTLENLFKVASLAGLFKFDLAVILNAYLGDVQIVTEFDDVRAEILGRFKNTMENLHNTMKKSHKDFDIYIVAHSEGTVVTLLSLLEEMSSHKAPDWLNHVRGLMTIGSPLDKHLFLWRELFEPKGEPLIQEWRPSGQGQIEWRNYYDHGDPIGFELEGMRRWLCENKWTAFNFKGTEDLMETEESKASKSFYDKCKDQVKKKLASPIHDFGFTRYYFPGKAHNDYWGDSQIFGHFIQTVVYQKEIEANDEKEKANFMPKEARFGKKHSESESSNPKKNKLDYSNPPATKRHAQLISYCAPYLLLMALMCIGVYVLYKATKGSLVGLENSQHESTLDVVMNVFGISSLLAGLTVMARIPRLTIAWYWRLLGAPICFALGALGYFVTTRTEPDFLSKSLYQALSIIGAKIGVQLPENLTIVVTSGMIVVALFVVLLSWLAEKSFQKWGLRTLMIFGGVAIAMILIGATSYKVGATSHKMEWSSLWPILLAAAFALYLWQTVILTFDLVFVWHRYIRHWRELGFSKWKPERAQNSTKPLDYQIGRRNQGVTSKLKTLVRYRER